jgi:hypothetical protein
MMLKEFLINLIPFSAGAIWCWVCFKDKPKIILHKLDWINVENKLPLKNQDVLVWNKKYDYPMVTQWECNCEHKYSHWVALSKPEK